MELIQNQTPEKAFDKRMFLKVQDRYRSLAPSISGLACIYSALILQDDEVTVTEDKINTLIKAAVVNVEPSGRPVCQALANVNIGSLICNVGADGPAPAPGAASAGGPAPTAAAAPAEKKVEAKKKKKLRNII
ncbi:60S acidic ribosomal protein P1-like [Suncus etruscus]|uniref:60S acidic ribosomal protein P1-like n=1 Tax=Suncus etruscus TaxID=109475 RepID=UPI00210FE73B|nr:60S acidic ribosomal protein P1-like [Suncus etruscus]